MTIENEQHRYLGNTDTSLSRNGICKLQALQKNGTYPKTDILLDVYKRQGVISLVTALTAEKIAPGTKEYLLASHQGKEPAAKQLLKALEKEAILDACLLYTSESRR